MLLFMCFSLLLPALYCKMIGDDTATDSATVLPASFQIRFLDNIADIDAQEWNALAGTAYPFLRHEFLLALEETGCTTVRYGWQPRHLTLRDLRGELVALMPLYLKTHSMGEYVFDWGWADAYQRQGLDYYPKLLSAIPFTPCAGPRLCVSASADADACRASALAAVKDLAKDCGASGWHLLFPEQDLSDALKDRDLLLRTGCQYQWFNRGFADFEAYLLTFNSRKRKTLRKEREAVRMAGVTLQTLEGTQITAAQWSRFTQFYANTYQVRGRKPYLNARFFEQLGKTMPAHLMLVLAEQAGEAIAGALFFKGSDTLYGRYWGAARDVSCLHFEACYYQGIEYCIRHGFSRMDSGAQGEHKIQRGFEPVKTQSLHWIAHPDFRRAIARFLEEEQTYIAQYMDQAAELLPFRKDLSLEASSLTAGLDNLSP